MSNFRSRYNKERGEINERAQNREEDSKSRKSWGNIINASKLPEGVKFFKVKEGSHVIDVLPFPAGTQHPKLEEGKTSWVLDLFVHQNVGVEEQSFICPTSTWGSKFPCPICQYEKAKGIKGDDWKNFNQRIKKRSIFLIWDRTTQEEEDKGVQIWEVAKFFMKDKLDVLQQQGSKITSFFDPDTGKHIVFTRKGSGLGNTEFVGHTFRDRDDIIPDSILDEADWAVDECVEMHNTYQTIYEAFFGEPCDEGRTTLPLASSGPSLEQESSRETVQKGPKEPDDVPDCTENDNVLECPAKGGEFGINFGQFKLCDRCDVWEDCEKEDEYIKAEEEEEAKAEEEAAAEAEAKAKEEEAAKAKAKPRASRRGRASKPTSRAKRG